MQFTSEISTAAVLGIGSHVLYFLHGEHHMKAPLLAVLIPICFTLLAIAHVPGSTFFQALQSSFLVCTAYSIGLFTSMTIYRVYFHPLRKFPGPPLASVSKFWHVFMVADRRNYLLLEKLHEKYGDIVRTGPNEVVVFKPEGFQVVHGPSSNCIKSDFYDMLQPDGSIHATRKPKLHTWRRRIFDQGFGTKALRSYEPRVELHVRRLEESLRRSAGKVIDCTELFLFFGFDVMGDIAFGQSFDMIIKNEMHSSVQIMRGGVDFVGMLTPIPWVVRILASIPGATRDWQKLEIWAEKQVRKRAMMDREESDIMSRLIDDARDEQTNDLDMRWLKGDASVIVIAGSDTVSITLTFLFYHLARMPQAVEKLRAELRKLESITDFKALQSLPYLNAFINETLRLFPPVMTAPLRKTPPEGLKVGDDHIPGEVNISTPLYSLGRLESSYVKAEEFIPERWYADGLIKDRSHFAPFLAGVHSCVGKQLALMEIRLVAAILVSKFDFDFAPGSDGSEVLDIRDCFTTVPGKLKLSFIPRT